MPRQKLTRVLIVVDVQNDFCPGGALPVPDGDAVVPVMNALIHSRKFAQVVVTQDWHPREHISFASTHGVAPFTLLTLADGSKTMVWPDHCVKWTAGASFHPALQLPKVYILLRKATTPHKDAYSGFQGNALAAALREEERFSGSRFAVYVAGLATDYCVKATALDAVKEGFRTYVILDACRGVAKDTTKQALKEMREAGIKIVRSANVLAAASQ